MEILMKKWFEGLKARRFRSGMARILALTLLTGEMIPAMPALEAMADAAAMKDGWEILEESGETMVSFPGTVRSELSSAEDTDAFSFTLTEKTDFTAVLDGAGCSLELYRQNEFLGGSYLPYSQSIEKKNLEPGIYTVRIASLTSGSAGEEGAAYVLRLQNQKARQKMPDYSEAHMGAAVFSFNSPIRIRDLADSETDQAGDFYDVMHYLAHWQGPVDESEAPYYKGNDFEETPSDYLHYKKADPLYHVQDMMTLPGNYIYGYEEHWKNALMTYGALSVGFWADYYQSLHDGRYEYLFTPAEAELSLDGIVNHGVVIVGWDDTIPKEKFWFGVETNSNAALASGSNAVFPTRDGAWICKDSYGSDSMSTDHGYFYISYDDGWLGNFDGERPMAFQTGEQTDNYNHLYSNSAAGMSPCMQLQDESDGGQYRELRPAAINIFHTGEEPELLRAVGFGAENGRLFYEISVMLPDENGECSLNQPIVVASGYEEYGGFHTERLDSGFLLPADSDVGIQVACWTEDSEDILFYANKNEEGYSAVKNIEGKSYVAEGGSMKEISGKGSYAAVLAYTYGTGEQQISLLDVHANTEKPKTASPSNALFAGAKESQTGLTPGYRGLEISENAREAGSCTELNMEFPARYDLRDENLVTPPKNQGVSSLCWAFAGVSALESTYLKRGGNMHNYPKGLLLSLADSEEVISGGTLEMEMKMKEGEPLSLEFCAELMTDSENFNPETEKIIWEAAGNGGSFEAGVRVSESGEGVPAITILEPGTYTVTARSLADSYLTASCRIIVTEQAPAKITLAADSMTMRVGEVRQLEAQVESDEDVSPVYTSDRPDVADVTADGKIFALKQGTAVITVRAGDASAQCAVTVVRRTSGNGSGEDSGNGFGNQKNKNRTDSRLTPASDAAGTMADTITGAWKRNETGWWLERVDGSYPVSSWEKIGGSWYFFKSDGYMAAGWFADPADGTWYYLGADGAMRTGWIYDERYAGWFWLGRFGAMATGWRDIGGIWYYFQEASDGTRGRMYAGRQTPDGYYVDGNGAWKKD